MEVHLHLFSAAEHPDSGVKPPGRDNHFPPADNLAVPGEEHLDEHRGATVSQHFHSWTGERESESAFPQLQGWDWASDSPATREFQNSLGTHNEDKKTLGKHLFLSTEGIRCSFISNKPFQATVWNICEQIHLDRIWDIPYPQKTALMRRSYAYSYCCISVESSILTLTQWAKTNNTVVDSW